MIRPKQRLTEKEKDKDWRESNLRFWNYRANLQISQNQDLKLLYRIAAGLHEEVDYSYVTNPLNSKYNDYPAKLRNFDIISPVFMQLLGEFIGRPCDPIVVAKNSDIEAVKQQESISQIFNSLQTAFVNGLIKQGIYVPGQVDEQGNPVEEPQHPELIKRKVDSMKDFKAIMGQNALDYIRDHQRLDEQDRTLFYDFIVGNLFISYKTIRGDDVIREICHPHNFYYFASSSVNYIEDAEAVKYVHFMSIPEVVDTFRDVEGFTEDMLDDLEARPSTGSGIGFVGDAIENENGYYSVLIPVVHIQWTSLCKIGERVVIDELGGVSIDEVDEDYKPIEGEQVNWTWVNQKREGWIINGRHYLGGYELKIQRGSITNPNSSKNSYNGKIFMSRGLRSVPLAARLMPYQESYNIIKYQIQKTINKNKDKISVIPLGLITTGKEGFDVDKALYYMDAMSTLFIDESAENAQVALQALKSIDLSLGNYIQWLYNYATQVKEEAYELVGFNRFRRSQTQASDAVYNVQQGQYTASLITEEWFKEFEEFREREYQGLIDLSKFAYSNGKKAAFIRNDSEAVYLKINPEDYCELEFGISVKNGGETKRNLDLLKAQATQFAQNQVKPSAVGKILNSKNNVSKLIEELELMEDEMMQQQQQAQQQAMEMEQAKLESEMQKHKDEIDLGYYKVNMEALTSQSQQTSSVTGETPLIDNSLEIQKLMVEREKSIRDNQTKKYVADQQFKIAKENRNV